MKHRSNYTRYRKPIHGFTLVELLVVISIIAILMSIIVPALAVARAQARGIVCKSNLKQLYVANRGYATENDGYYVIAAKDIRGANLHRWHGVRKNRNAPFNPEKSPLADYWSEGGVKKCPSFGKGDYYEASGQRGANFEAGCGGYGYNSEYVGGRSDLYGMMEASKHSANVSDIKNSAKTVMFTDTAFRQSFQSGREVFVEYSFVHPPYWHWYIEMVAQYPSISNNISGRPSPSIHFRHNGFSNVSWCDGHITKETMDLSAPYVTHALMDEEETTEMALGWFGPDNNSLFDLK